MKKAYYSIAAELSRDVQRRVKAAEAKENVRLAPYIAAATVGVCVCVKQL